MAKTCSHLDEIVDPEPKTPQGCEECLAMGDNWVHLRLCETCGHLPRGRPVVATIPKISTPPNISTPRSIRLSNRSSRAKIGRIVMWTICLWRNCRHERT